MRPQAWGLYERAWRAAAFESRAARAALRRRSRDVRLRIRAGPVLREDLRSHRFPQHRARRPGVEHASRHDARVAYRVRRECSQPAVALQAGAARADDDFIVVYVLRSRGQRELKQESRAKCDFAATDPKTERLRKVVPDQREHRT